ncbi:MAG: flagellar basal-body MS-ring/collar protein FliF [Pseudomonadota bacterium]
MAEAVVVGQAPGPGINTLIRQAGVMIGIAASVALGFYVVMWAQKPSFTMLYSDMSDRDVSRVVDQLDALAIPYEIDFRSGAILVASDRVHDARIKLAATGLPKSGGMGLELLQEEQSFGTSQFIEKARYQHAIEGELSRSIARIDNVRAARVHLAIPKQSVFARQARMPSASVVVDLYGGRSLGAQQVSAIAHLVSASVPNLSPDDVTVVDQRGNLLTDGGGADELALAAKQFDYVRRLEQSYINRIEGILGPLVGVDGVRAQVTAELDFTRTEQTRESFNPDLPAIRSERLLEEERRGAVDSGVPGALSNQPPLEAEAPEVAPAGEEGETIVEEPTNRRTQSTRNYELDRTVSHTRPAVGTLRRISVAVVVRNPAADQQAGAAAGENASSDEGSSATTAASGFAAEQLEQMDRLVKDAIGFDPTRGDSVRIDAVDFLKPPTPEPLPPTPIWEQAWVWSTAKQFLGGVFVLFVLFGVIRPAMKSLMKKPEPTATQMLAADGTPLALPAGDGGIGGQGADGAPRLEAQGAQSGQLLLSDGSSMEGLDEVRDFVAQEPKIAAQVVKSWVSE